MNHTAASIQSLDQIVSQANEQLAGLSIEAHNTGLVTQTLSHGVAQVHEQLAGLSNEVRNSTDVIRTSVNEVKDPGTPGQPCSGFADFVSAGQEGCGYWSQGPSACFSARNQGKRSRSPV